MAESMTVCGGDMPQRTVTMSRGAADMKICCESEKLFGNISGSDIISELAVIAFADFTDFVDIEEGMAVPKEISRIPPEKRRAVAYIKNGTGSKGAEVKLYDKMRRWSCWENISVFSTAGTTVRRLLKNWTVSWRRSAAPSGRTRLEFGHL